MPAQMHLAHIVDLRLDHGRNEARKGRLHADAAADARRQRLAPAGFLRRQIQHRAYPRILAQHRAAEFHRVPPGLAGEFVHEALEREHVVVRADTAPEAGRHA
jgi:hypothetical protein